LVWQLAEDSLDEYVIRRIEAHTRNIWIRIAARTGLNPTRAFANLVALRAPWSRDDRSGVSSYVPARQASQPKPAIEPALREATTFEFAVTPRIETYLGAGGGQPCVGGDASGAWRVAPEWLLVAQVGGCRFTGIGRNRSGDALNYLLGPRWTPAPDNRWSPWLQFLMGGAKITHEQMLPDRKAVTAEHDEYTTGDDANALAFHFGAGVDLKMSAALALRVANLEYSHSTLAPAHRQSYGNSIQFTTGLVLRVGTW
jgi:hypothetical protein